MMLKSHDPATFEKVISIAPSFDNGRASREIHPTDRNNLPTNNRNNYGTN